MIPGLIFLFLFFSRKINPVKDDQELHEKTETEYDDK